MENSVWIWDGNKLNFALHLCLKRSRFARGHFCRPDSNTPRPRWNKMVRHPCLPAKMAKHSTMLWVAFSRGIGPFQAGPETPVIFGPHLNGQTPVPGTQSGSRRVEIDVTLSVHAGKVWFREETFRTKATILFFLQTEILQDLFGSCGQISRVKQRTKLSQKVKIKTGKLG